MAVSFAVPPRGRGEPGRVSRTPRSARALVGRHPRAARRARPDGRGDLARGGPHRQVRGADQLSGLLAGPRERPFARSARQRISHRRRVGCELSPPNRRGRPPLQRVQPARDGRRLAGVRFEPFPRDGHARGRRVRTEQPPARHPVAEGDGRKGGARTALPRARPPHPGSCSRSSRSAARRPRMRSAPTTEATCAACGGALRGSFLAATTERGHRPSCCSTRTAPVSSSSGASMHAAGRLATPCSISAQAAPRPGSGGESDSLAEPARTGSKRKEALDEP